MSLLKTTICLPECVSKSYTGLVGISSHDHNVYIWQRKRKESHSILTIYQVNPLVPSSWRVFKEIIFVDDKTNIPILACFNACCSKIAFTFPTTDEFVIVDMTSDTETHPIVRLRQGAMVCEFAETAVGWVEVCNDERKMYCCKMFPESGENKVLFTLSPSPEPPILDSSDKMIGLTYDSFMYLEVSNNLWKVVSYDMLSGNSVEMAFGQWNPHMEYPFLISASDRSYLIQPSVDLGTHVYKVHQDHLGITLTYLNKLDHDIFMNFDIKNLWKAGNDKIAVIHPVYYSTPRFLSVAHLGVPSLKSMSVWAVQKLYGTIGDNGELVDGISEEELKKSIGYQQNKKLF